MTITKQVKSVLPFKVGAVVELTGKVTKRVRREGECKLVIEPGDVPGFVVFADCTSDAETVRNSKIRKGSLVSVRGKFLSYGSKAVCLSDCRLMPEGNLEQLGTLKKENTKTEQRRTQ
jgi:primosomal replication protein N